MQESKHPYWIIAGLITLIFASYLLGQSQTVQEYTAPSGSSYSGADDGLSIIYQILEERRQALRWERPPGRLPDTVDRLVLWDPPERAVSDRDWDDLLEWVAKGHTLLIYTRDDFQRRLPARVLHGDPSREALPAALHPFTQGLTRLQTGGAAFRDLNRAVTVLVVDDRGAPVLVEWVHGEGRIYWSADGTWLSNSMITEANNASLATAILTPARGKRVAFDEFHHGFHAADHWFAILRGPLKWFVLHLLLATLVLFWAYGARFGQPMPSPSGSQRAAIDYVFSLSHLYRRANARESAARALYQGLRLSLSRLVGGARGLSHAELASRAAERLPELHAGQVQALLDRLDPKQGAPPQVGDLVRLATESEAVQRRIRHARESRDT